MDAAVRKRVEQVGGSFAWGRCILDEGRYRVASRRHSCVVLDKDVEVGSLGKGSERKSQPR